MVEVVWGRLFPIHRQRRRGPGRRLPRLLRVVALLRWVVALGVCFRLGWGIATETRTSYLQSRLLSRWVADMKFTIRPGPSRHIRFPKSGPYDERLGYVQLPNFIEALKARHFIVAKERATDYPSPGFPRFGNDHARTPSF